MHKMIKSRKSFGFLGLMLLLLAFMPVKRTSAASTSEKANNAYYNYIRENIDIDEDNYYDYETPSYFASYDIDGDKIPELILSSFDNDGYIKIYTYKNNRVQLYADIYAALAFAIDSKNKALVVYNSRHPRMYSIFNYKKNIDMGKPDVEFWDFEGDYAINNVTVSESKYNREFSKYDDSVRLNQICYELTYDNLDRHLGPNAGAYILNKKSVTLKVNKSERLSLVDVNGIITWTSSDKSKVSVSSDGMITAKKPGKVTITAELNGKKYKCEVTVPVPTYKLDKANMLLEKNKSKTLKLVDATGTIKWTSSDSSVASVNSKGKITAKRPGKTTITASFEGKKYTCKITIPDKVLSPMKITKIDSKEIYYKELLEYGDTEYVYDKTVNKNKLTSSTKYYVNNYNTYKLESVSNKVFTKSFNHGYYTIYLLNNEVVRVKEILGG